jgi:hypothetical protein
VGTYEQTKSMNLQLTRQETLWPGYRGHSYNTTPESPYTFQFKDKILAGCFYPTTDNTLTSFLSQKNTGYALLIYLSEIAFGIRRYPWAIDRVAYDCSDQIDTKNKLKHLMLELTPKRIESMVSELKELYEFTQNQLSSKGLTHVNLVRHIADKNGILNSRGSNYAITIAKLKSNAEVVTQDSISFEMDVINPFSCSASFYKDLQQVTIFQKVPIEDVLCCSALLETNEGDEWLIMNRAPDGVVSVKTEDIIVDKSIKLPKSSPEEAQEILKKRTPYVLRAKRSDGDFTASFGYKESWIKSMARRVFNNS